MSMLSIVYKYNGWVKSIMIPNDEDKGMWELLSTYAPKIYDALSESDILDVKVIE